MFAFHIRSESKTCESARLLTPTIEMIAGFLDLKGQVEVMIHTLEIEAGDVAVGGELFDRGGERLEGGSNVGAVEVESLHIGEIERIQTAVTDTHDLNTAGAWVLDKSVGIMAHFFYLTGVARHVAYGETLERCTSFVESSDDMNHALLDFADTNMV